MKKTFEKIDRLIEFKKSIIIRHYNGGMAFDIAARHLAHKAFADDKVIMNTNAALAAIDYLRLENIIEITKKTNIYDDAAVKRVFDRAAHKIAEKPFIIAFSNYRKFNIIPKAAETFPDKKFYVLSQVGTGLDGNDGFVLKKALNYRGLEFFNSWEYNAKIPENLYFIIVDNGGYYSFESGNEIFPSILIKPDPDLIEDESKRELHILVNKFITEETGCRQFLLGEKYYQRGEPFEDTVETVINAVYSEFYGFIDNGPGLVENCDRLIMKLRENIHSACKL